MTLAPGWHVGLEAQGGEGNRECLLSSQELDVVVGAHLSGPITAQSEPGIDGGVDWSRGSQSEEWGAL